MGRCAAFVVKSAGGDVTAFCGRSIQSLSIPPSKRLGVYKGGCQLPIGRERERVEG